LWLKFVVCGISPINNEYVNSQIMQTWLIFFYNSIRKLIIPKKKINRALSKSNLKVFYFERELNKIG